MANIDDIRPNEPTQKPADSVPIEGADAAPVEATPEEPVQAPDPEIDGDPETDKAVDEITKNEGDEVLKAQDEAAEKNVVMKQGKRERFKNAWAAWWGNPRKRWGTIGGIVVVLLALFAVPFTRYNILGLALKASATVTVVDSKTGAAVSGAAVKFGGQTAQTDGEGRASLTIHAGSKSLDVSKKYYRGYTHGELVTLSGSKNHYKATLVALGHQVKVKVVDKVSGKPLPGATITVQGASAKTDKNGLATVVTPSSADKQAATASLTGYNMATVSISASGDVGKNTFSLTPAGKLYFLSNLSGKIDVVKTNLDGSDRQTVLAGTGNEDRNTTSLLASRDWKYLALLSKRSGDNASVYLIDTTQNDKLTTIDEGNANFSLVGWSSDRFIYQVARNGVQNWQPNQQALKSFDPTTGHTLLLDQTQGTGVDDSNYASQSFSAVYLMGNQVTYVKSWFGKGFEGGVPDSSKGILNGKQAVLDTIGADGSGHKTLKSVAFPTQTYSLTGESLYLASQLYEPDGLYLSFTDSAGNHYYKYDDGKVADTTEVNDNNFYNGDYATYLLSPSGNSTFWADQRDGKNTLFVGDEDGKNQKQIASLSDYNTYGWYTDNYLLVSKNSSELYIMPTNGSTPLKITDYYKPAINYQGYGGGYGGL